MYNADDEGLKNPVALLRGTDEYVFAGAAHSYWNVAFQCPECKAELVFKNASKDGKRQHFAHKVKSACNGMSDEHFTAQLLLEQHIDKFQFNARCYQPHCNKMLFDLCWFDADDVECHREYKLDKFRIDVAVLEKKTKKPLAFLEVHWKSPVSAEKKEFLRKNYPNLLHEVETADVLRGRLLIDSDDRVCLRSKSTGDCHACLSGQQLKLDAIAMEIEEERAMEEERKKQEEIRRAEAERAQKEAEHKRLEDHKRWQLFAEKRNREWQERATAVVPMQIEVPTPSLQKPKTEKKKKAAAEEDNNGCRQCKNYHAFMTPAEIEELNRLCDKYKIHRRFCTNDPRYGPVLASCGLRNLRHLRFVQRDEQACDPAIFRLLYPSYM